MMDLYKKIILKMINSNSLNLKEIILMMNNKNKKLFILINHHQRTWSVKLIKKMNN